MNFEILVLMCLLIFGHFTFFTDHVSTGNREKTVRIENDQRTAQKDKSQFNLQGYLLPTTGRTFAASCCL